MEWFGGGRKLRIEGGGCADMTRISNFLADQRITNVLSQVRIVDTTRAIVLGSVERVDVCQTVDHPARPRGKSGVTPNVSPATNVCTDAFNESVEYPDCGLFSVTRPLRFARSARLQFSNGVLHVVARNVQVEPGVWELEATLNVKVGSTVKIVGQVG